MTRFFNQSALRLCALVLCILPAAGRAGEYVTDAFGLTAGAATGVRSDWADLVSAGNGAPDRVLIFVGPKSLVAGKDIGHAVALVVDKHGNLVPDGTPVTLTIDGEETVVSTRGGIADHQFLPHPEARQIVAGASALDRQSTRAVVRVVPDIGSIVPELVAPDKDILADAFFGIETGALTDRFGNTAEDGSLITILLRHEDGSHSLASADAQRGVARTTLLSRDISGVAGVDASIAANAAQPVSVRILRPKARGLPAIAITPLPGIESVRITLGPFLTANGHVLTDGAAARIEVTDTQGTRHIEQGWVRDGYVSAVVPVDDLNRIAALGVTTPLGEMTLDARAAEIAANVLEEVE